MFYYNKGDKKWLCWALLHERKKRHTNPTLEQKLVFHFVTVWLAQLAHAIKRGRL
jgi:hypothetical protein